MQTQLRAPYADVRPGDLTWHLGLAPQPALATLTVPLLCVGSTSLSVELRLLGASHQVLVRTGAVLTCSETVASGGDGVLPARARRDLPGAAYAFSSSCHSLSPDGFATVVARLRAQLAGRSDALVGAFPGLPDALTAVRVAAGGMGWRTWHAYPQTREVVTTRTSMEIA